LPAFFSTAILRFSNDEIAVTVQDLLQDETYVPTEPAQAGAQTWVPGAYGNQGGTPDPEAPPREGTRAALAVEIRTPGAPIAASFVTTDDKHNQTAGSRQRFARDNRLLDLRAFRRVFKNAKRSRDTMFTVLCRPNQDRGARLGMAISKKNCRLAVERNRLKRIVRESFRRHKADLDGLDVVVMCRGAAAGAENRELFDSLAAHWQRCVTAAGSRTEREEA
jgi:ribonuclease P protein component